MKHDDEVFAEAKQRVEKFIQNHLREHECVYPSDAANELGLEYELVREIFSILEKEDKICRKGE